MNKKIIFFDDVENIAIEGERLNPIRIYNEDSKVIKLFEQGQVGANGKDGFSPFQIVSDVMVGTASFAFLGEFSSSLIPTQINSFDIGSLANRWRRLYLYDEIDINSTIINSGSFEMGNYSIFNKIDNDSHIFVVKNNNVSMSFNENGILVIPDFQTTPTSVFAGLIKSGSDIYVGL